MAGYHVSESASNNQILVVDDSRVIRRAAIKILDKEFSVVEAEDGQQAWDVIQKNKKISMVFTDLGMPNMTGYELLEHIRNSSDPAVAKLPVIVITGAEESEGAKEDAFKRGATDFISKPFDSIALKTRAAAHINYRQEVQALEQRAATDKLTGLLTETAFKQQGEQALAYAQRHVTEITVVQFEIDRFAEMFVKLGKDAGEQIIAKVASIIRETMRKEDSAARLGVSKFALLLPSSNSDGAMQAINRICQRVASLKLKIGQDVFQIQFSAGVATADTEITSFDILLQQAETAKQQSIKQGGGKIIRHGAKVVAAAPAMAHVDVNIEQLLQALGKGDKNIKPEQLASALRKFLPLMDHADQQLKLGLSKVVAHLKQKLK
jgi:diguanylate cyclase (GGDEF)-like protein